MKVVLLSLALALDGVPLGNVAADVKTVAVYEIDPTAIAVDLSTMPEVPAGGAYEAEFTAESGTAALSGTRFEGCACYYGAR